MITSIVGYDAQAKFAKVAEAVGLSKGQFFKMCTKGLRGPQLKSAEQAAGGSDALIELINKVAAPQI